MNELLANFAAVPFRVPADGIATPPARIMYLPGGEHEVQCLHKGKPAKLKVTVDERTARDLERDLQARLKDGGPAPFFDLHHEGREAAAYPVKFQWEDGGGLFAEGVYALVTWTPAGVDAVTCAAGQMPKVRYFSPRANYDERAQRITGLMPASAGNAAGGLVSDPAFTKISPLTAGKAPAHAGTNNNTKDKPMTELQKALVASGVLTEAEAAADNAHELTAARIAELKAAKAASTVLSAAPDKSVELTAKLETLTGELAAMKGQLADKFVGELVASGKIPPQAEATKKMWRANWLADEKAAEAAAAEIVATKAIESGNLTEEEGKPVPGNTRGELQAAKARQLRAVNPGLSWDDAWNAAGAEITAGK